MTEDIGVIAGNKVEFRPVGELEKVFEKGVTEKGVLDQRKQRAYGGQRRN